jgi:predicted NACHT family NTPase
LAKVRRLVVLGDPGAGKTTLIRWIATAYLLRLKQDPDWRDLPDVATLPNADWLPIVIRCRDLDPRHSGGSLDDVLRHILRKAELSDDDVNVLRVVLPEKLRNGEAILLLDGLDEIIDPGLRARFARQLEQIHLAYPDAPIIATSRIVGYREMGYRIARGFEHVTVAEFSRRDKNDFARRWCAVTEIPSRQQSATDELIRDIHSTDRIERLTGNPMLLTTMALVKRKVGKLPSRRADLYWEAVHVLLNWRGEVDEPIDQHEAFPQLEYIAYVMCSKGVQQLHEDELLTALEQMRLEYTRVHAIHRHSPAEFVRLLEGRTGLLVEAGTVRHHGRQVPVLEFRHLTFQEYLAALALVEGRFPNRDRSKPLADHVAPLAGTTSGSFRDSRGNWEGAVTENWRETLRLCTTYSLTERRCKDHGATAGHPGSPVLGRRTER